MSTEDRDAARAIQILNHPLRIRIIEEVGSAGGLTWKDLSIRLGTSTGNLYHHLDVLERIVTRDSSRRYVLTKLGQDVYHYLKENSSTRDTRVVAKLLRGRTFWGPFLGVVIPRSVIQWLSLNRARSILSSVGIAVSVLAAMIVARALVIFLYVLLSQDAIHSALGFGGSVLILILGVYLGSVLFGTRANPFALVVSVCAAFVPLAIFSLVIRLLISGGVAESPGGASILTLVLVVFQGWSGGVFGAGISVATGLRIEKALLGSLAVLYASAVIMLVIGVRFV